MPKSKIKKDFILKGYPKEVINDALIEAEDAREDPQTKSTFKKEALQPTISATPAEPTQPALEETEKTNPFFFFLIFIILVWLGIAVSFNIADTFGKAIDTFTPQKDMRFTDFCTHKISNGQSEKICALGQDLIDKKQTDAQSVKSACATISFDIRRVNDCNLQLTYVIEEYQFTN